MLTLRQLLAFPQGENDDHPDAPMLYAKLAQRFITWMTSHTSAGILFDVDTALRPDGASGMLVLSVAAFARYQDSAAWVWEHQALTRARFCAGDAAIGETQPGFGLAGMHVVFVFGDALLDAVDILPLVGR